MDTTTKLEQDIGQLLAASLSSTTIDAAAELSRREQEQLSSIVPETTPPYTSFRKEFRECKKDIDALMFIVTNNPDAYMPYHFDSISVMRELSEISKELSALDLAYKPDEFQGLDVPSQFEEPVQSYSTSPVRSVKQILEKGADWLLGEFTFTMKLDLSVWSRVGNRAHRAAVAINQAVALEKAVKLQKEAEITKAKQNATLLQKAHEIIYERSEEKERKYGPFNEGMERAAMIASGMTGKNITANDMFAALIALKFSRISYTPDHYDSYLDAAAYTAQMYNYNSKNDGNQIP